MNKPYIFLFVFLALSALLTISVLPVKASGDFWVKRAPMPNGLAGFGAVSVNGKIYAIGDNFTYMFDPSPDSWVSKTPMPSHRRDSAIAAYQGKIYVIGGWNSIDPKTGIAITMGTNEMFDPVTDTWTTKAPMPMPAADLQANVVDGKIYVISGISDIAKPTLSSSNWVYDPSSNSWNEAASITNAVFNYASAVVENKIYIEGGDAGKSSAVSSLNQIYDPETNSWTIGQPLPTAVRHAGAGVTTGTLAPARLYIIGGTNNCYDGVSATQIYDPQTDNWTIGAQMPTARLNLAVAVVNDTLYAFGGISSVDFGYAGTVYPVNEQYIPLDYQGVIPSSYVPTPSPYITSSPTPTSSPSAAVPTSEDSSASPTASSQPPHSMESFPAVPVAVVSAASATVACGVLLYWAKYKKTSKTQGADKA